MTTYNLKTWKKEQVILRQELHYGEDLIGLHDTMVSFNDADTIQEMSGSVNELTGPNPRATKKRLHNVIENTLLTHASMEDDQGDH